MDELISIIVPVYNVENYLSKCIDSLILQTYKNIEIILIDDGSIDGSGKICDDYAKKDDRINVIHIKNSGVSNARNKGMELCRGEYITFCDSDDYLDSDAYENVINIFKNFDVDIVKFQNIKELGKYKNYSKNSLYGVIDYSKNKNIILDLFLKFHEFGPIWSSVFKREKIRGLKFDSNYKYGEDYLFYIQCIFNTNSMYIMEKYYYHYIINPNSSTQKITEEMFWNNFVTHCEIDFKVYNLVIDNGYGIYKDDLLQCTYNMLNNLLKNMAFNLEYSKYKKLLLQINESSEFKRYRSLDYEFNKKEYNNIFEKKIVWVYVKNKLYKIVKSLCKKIVKFK